MSTQKSKRKGDQEMRSMMRGLAFVVLAAVALVMVTGGVLAQTPEEIEQVVRAITGDLTLGDGVALAALVIVVVGLVRRFTGWDGPRVRWLVFGVSLAAIAIYNVLEGGMDIVAAALSAIGVFLTAIGGHETAGKWLRELLTGAAGKASSTG